MKLIYFFTIFQTIIHFISFTTCSSEAVPEGRKAFNYQMGLRKAKLLKSITGPNDTAFEKAVKELMTQFVIEAEAEIMESSIKSETNQRKNKKRQSSEDFEAILQEALKYREQAIDSQQEQASQNESEVTAASVNIDTELTSTSAPLFELPRTFRPVGGLWGAVEGFVSVIPYAPGAAVETTGNLAKYLVGLLPLPNVTDVVTTTLTGVRKRPIHTAITGLSNLVFCSPPIAGINYGRCYAWFQTRENEEEIRVEKLAAEAAAAAAIANGTPVEEKTSFFGIFDETPQNQPK